jgi:hypothetical protein
LRKSSARVYCSGHTLVKRVGIGVAALAVVEVCQVVEAVCDIGMIGPECHLADCEELSPIFGDSMKGQAAAFLGSVATDFAATSIPSLKLHT